MGNSTLAPTPDSGPLALQPPDLSAADFRLSRRELPVNGRGMSVFVVGREGPREGGSPEGRVPGFLFAVLLMLRGLPPFKCPFRPSHRDSHSLFSCPVR